MLWAVALHEGNGLTQSRDVGGEYTCHELIYRLGASCHTPQVWVDHRLCRYPFIDLEPHVGGVILWVMQSLFVDIHIVYICCVVVSISVRGVGR